MLQITSLHFKPMAQPNLEQLLKTLILKDSGKAKIGEVQMEATKMIRSLDRYEERLIRVGVFSLARDE